MTLGLLSDRLSILLKREFKIAISYRMTAVLSVVSGVAGLMVYGLLGNSAVVSVTSETYGMSLASYLVSGVAFGSIINNGLTMFHSYAGPSQIEETMVTPTGFREYILMSSSLSIFTSIGSAVLFFIASTFFFGLSYSYDIPVLLVTILLGILTSIGLGFIGLGFHLVYKQTAVLSWLLFSFTGLVGNMLVPVEVLPEFVRIMSYMTPHYYFFTAIRVGLGSDVASAASVLIPFALYSSILLVIGHLALNHGLRFVKRNGTHRWM